MISLKNATKDYGRGPVLDDVSLTINPGEFVCLVGHSGAGKSTLLSLLMGAETVTSGGVTVDGVDLRDVPAGALQIFRRKLGIVFQDFKLLQNRTVAENIAFPLEVCGMSDAAIEKRVAELLKRMELTKCKNSLPRELSGGEKARTAIARALAHNPLILLADEPTQNLDMRQAVAVLQAFRDINAEGTTVVVATHDAALVEALRARVVHMENGKVVKDTAAEPVREKKVTPPPVIEEREIDSERLERIERVKAQRKVKITAIRSE
jgi:cell division transport system ATP-binding protein